MNKDRPKGNSSPLSCCLPIHLCPLGGECFCITLSHRSLSPDACSPPPAFLGPWCRLRQILQSLAVGTWGGHLSPCQQPNGLRCFMTFPCICQPSGEAVAVHESPSQLVHLVRIAAKIRTAAPQHISESHSKTSPLHLLQFSPALLFSDNKR